MSLTRCVQCGTEIDENTIFCSSCGASQPAQPAAVSRWLRLGGAIIDGIIQGAITGTIVLGMFGFQALTRVTPTLLTLKFRLAAFLITMVVYAVVNGYLLATRGQTVGKLALGMKIVDMQGELPSLPHLIILRFAVIQLASQIPFIGILFVLVDACFIFGNERRCLHDYIAGTRVVKA